jgi:hypothetical protein
MEKVFIITLEFMIPVVAVEVIQEVKLNYKSFSEAREAILPWEECDA